MNLREELLSEHSKAQCNKIVQWVGASEKRFEQLFHLFLTEEYRVNQRAAWPVSYCVIAHPSFIKKKFGKLVKNLRKPGLHDSVKRNSIRFLKNIDIPEKYHGDIMDICFGYLASPKEAVAIKVFSLIVLGNLSKKYPEIKPEIKVLIDEQLPHQTIAFKGRAQKLLNSWNKKEK
ncbi:MAG TPA: hypothetical protein VMY77_03275 [Chitinophagaceae bacterium]|nr:hypothetical protein [Chitinophagaceae bacterium]